VGTKVFVAYVSDSCYPFHFQAGGRRWWPILASVFCANFMLQYILLWMHVCFCCVCFSY